jgi:hypothetical protein
MSLKHDLDSLMLDANRDMTLADVDAILGEPAALTLEQIEQLVCSWIETAPTETAYGALLKLPIPEEDRRPAA